MAVSRPVLLVLLSLAYLAAFSTAQAPSMSPMPPPMMMPMAPPPMMIPMSPGPSMMMMPASPPAPMGPSMSPGPSMMPPSSGETPASNAIIQDTSMTMMALFGGVAVLLLI